MLDLNTLQIINNECGHIKREIYIKLPADIIHYCFYKVGTVYKSGTHKTISECLEEVDKKMYINKEILKRQ